MAPKSLAVPPRHDWRRRLTESSLTLTEERPKEVTGGKLGTGFRFFTECLRHSTKAKLYSAKPLPSAALGKEHNAKN